MEYRNIKTMFLTEKNCYKIYKKSPVSMAVALLLFLSVDRCYQLRTRYPTRAAQGPRPYK